MRLSSELDGVFLYKKSDRKKKQEKKKKKKKKEFILFRLTLSLFHYQKADDKMLVCKFKKRMLSPTGNDPLKCETKAELLTPKDIRPPIFLLNFKFLTKNYILDVLMIYSSQIYNL